MNTNPNSGNSNRISHLFQAAEGPSMPPELNDPENWPVCPDCGGKHPPDMSGGVSEEEFLKFKAAAEAAGKTVKEMPNGGFVVEEKHSEDGTISGAVGLKGKPMDFLLGNGWIGALPESKAVKQMRPRLQREVWKRILTEFGVKMPMPDNENKTRVEMNDIIFPLALANGHKTAEKWIILLCEAGWLTLYSKDGVIIDRDNPRSLFDDNGPAYGIFSSDFKPNMKGLWDALKTNAPKFAQCITDDCASRGIDITTMKVEFVAPGCLETVNAENPVKHFADGNDPEIKAAMADDDEGENGTLSFPGDLPGFGALSYKKGPGHNDKPSDDTPGWFDEFK